MRGSTPRSFGCINRSVSAHVKRRERNSISNCKIARRRLQKNWNEVIQLNLVPVRYTKDIAQDSSYSRARTKIVNLGGRCLLSSFWHLGTYSLRLFD